jgi:CubicO group peptidase (beta-lactamase class C family)
VTGKSLSAFLEERIWKPLDMADTGFSVPEAKKARYALAFANDPASGKPQSIPHASGRPIKFDCGGGCAVDCARISALRADARQRRDIGRQATSVAQNHRAYGERSARALGKSAYHQYHSQ